MSEFSLHRQLRDDCHLIGDLELSRVLLLNDCRYPWVVLVPRRAAITEVYQLTQSDRQLLLDESCRVGQLLMQTFEGDKLNLGALGNLVPQLHVHLVVRRLDDPAWPGPVWGHSPAVPYPEPSAGNRVQLLRVGLGLPA